MYTYKISYLRETIEKLGSKVYVTRRMNELRRRKARPEEFRFVFPALQLIEESRAPRTILNKLNRDINDHAECKWDRRGTKPKPIYNARRGTVVDSLNLWARLAGLQIVLVADVGRQPVPPARVQC